jgi:hypothetical protein
MSQMDSLVKIIFIFSSVVVAIQKILKTLHGPKGHGPESWRQIVRWLILYYCLNFGVMITEPYVYQHYIEAGTSPKEITTIYLAPYFVNAVFRFIPIKIVKHVGATPVIAAGGVFCSLATLLRTKKNFDALCVAQVLIAMARNAFELSCSDWKFGEGSHEKTGDMFFHNVVSATKAVMTTIIMIVSVLIKRSYDGQMLFYIGTGASLIAVLASLVVFKKSAYPTRKEPVKPTYFGIAILFFFTLFEVYFTPRIMTLVTDQSATFSLASLFGSVMLMQLLGDSIKSYIDIKVRPEIIVAVTGICSAVLVGVIIVLFEQKWLVLILSLVTVVVARVGRIALEKIGSTAIELMLLYGVMVYGGYKLGGETSVEMNLKISAVSAFLAAMISLIKLRKEPQEDDKDNDEYVI